MIKRRKKWIIILGSAALFLGILYFAVLMPLLAKLNRTEDTGPELLPGEVLGVNSRILLFEHVEQTYIESIEVHNQKDDWKLYRGEDDSFYLERYEKAPLNAAMVSSLVVSAGYPLSVTRVTTECTDLSEYGLAPENDPSWYVLTTMSGAVHKVWIGDLLPTGGGYYCRYDGRDAVYVLDTDMAVLLAPVESMTYPLLSYPVGTQDYYLTENFTIFHGEDIFVSLTYAGEMDLPERPTSSLYLMLEPTDYVPHADNYATILKQMCEFIGSETLVLGESETPISAEVLAGYGLDDPMYAVAYTYNDVDSYVFFSELQYGGFYYAYSSIWNLIAKVESSAVEFLTWDLIQFVDVPIYQVNINDVAEMTFESPTFRETFTLRGEGNDIQITPASTGKVFDEFYLHNFRQLYKSFLVVYMQNYADKTETNEEDLILTVRVTLDNGTVYEYKFYAYSTRRCYYTVNGEGDFYVLRDAVEKVSSDGIKLLAGEDIDSWAKN